MRISFYYIFVLVLSVIAHTAFVTRRAFWDILPRSVVEMSRLALILFWLEQRTYS
jgi:hypothetical protein